ncbi:hypothetical protein [Promicromonospora soli]
MPLSSLVRMSEQTYTDLPALAAQYAQLSAVLAGFAFAGLISVALVPAMSVRPARETVVAVRPLAVTMFSLTMTSITYSMLAGEVYIGPRTTSLFPVAATQLTFAPLILLLALIVLIVGIERDLPVRLKPLRSAVTSLRGLITFTWPVFVLAIYSRLRDHVYEPGNTAGQYGAPDVLFWVLCGPPVVFGLIVAVAHVVARHRLRETMRGWPQVLARVLRAGVTSADEADKRLVRVLSRIAMVGTLFCVGLVSGARGMLSPETSLPLAVEVFVAGVMAWFCVPLTISAMTYGRYSDPREPGEKAPVLGIEVRETDPRHGRPGAP